jgi:hypothetical protein
MASIASIDRPIGESLQPRRAPRRSTDRGRLSRRSAGRLMSAGTGRMLGV